MQVGTYWWWILVSRLVTVLIATFTSFFVRNWRCTWISFLLRIKAWLGPIEPNSFLNTFYLSFIVAPTGSPDDDFCKEELFRNITWMRTPKGKTIERHCPYGSSGKKWRAHAFLLLNNHWKCRLGQKSKVLNSKLMIQIEAIMFVYSKHTQPKVIYSIIWWSLKRIGSS